jgi:hypothetical protein
MTTPIKEIANQNGLNASSNSKRMSMTMARSVDTASPAKYSQSKIRGNFPQPSIISEQRVNRKED